MSDPRGLWLVLAVLVPFIGMLLGLLLGGRWAQRVALLTLLLGLGISLAIAAAPRKSINCTIAIKVMNR